MSPQDMRSTLISRTITVIATEGLDKTTTKAITSGTGINEVYIYRQFAHKEDLLSKAFEELDSRFVAKVMQHLPVMYMRQMDYELRCRMFFEAIWQFMLENKEECLAFVRYYYSPYFEKYSIADHKKRYSPLVKKFSEAFQSDVDVWMILHHILNVMLDFAVRVHNNHLPNNSIYTEQVFRIIFASVKSYFKNAEEQERYA